MAISRISATLEQFEAVTNAPGNEDKRFEFIEGEIIELPSNAYSSQLAAYVVAALLYFADERDLGHVTTENGGYIVNGWRFAPDVAFVSKARQEYLADKGYNPIAPDLAVEIVSPTDDPDYIETKQRNYESIGVVTWWFYPVLKRVEIHVPGKRVQVLGIDDVIDGGDILPGFKLPVRRVFRR